MSYDSKPLRRTVQSCKSYAKRPSALICGLCPSITDTSMALSFPHMLIIYAVLNHDVERARRVVTPSGIVVWRLPDRRELAVLWQLTGYRL